MPSFHEVADYEMSHAGGFRQPNAYLREKNVADHQLNRYGPGTAAPMYEATLADFEWLEHMNSGATRREGDGVRDDAERAVHAPGTLGEAL